MPKYKLLVAMEVVIKADALHEATKMFWRKITGWEFSGDRVPPVEILQITGDDFREKFGDISRWVDKPGDPNGE
jgi:hypothetical protein